MFGTIFDCGVKGADIPVTPKANALLLAVLAGVINDRSSIKFSCGLLANSLTMDRIPI